MRRRPRSSAKQVPQRGNQRENQEAENCGHQESARDQHDLLDRVQRHTSVHSTNILHLLHAVTTIDVHIEVHPHPIDGGPRPALPFRCRVLRGSRGILEP